jgi:hypothetical protein
MKPSIIVSFISACISAGVKKKYSVILKMPVTTRSRSKNLPRLTNNAIYRIGNKLNNENLFRYAQTEKRFMSILGNLLQRRKYNRFVTRGNALYTFTLTPGVRRALQNLANKGVGHRHVMQPLRNNNKRTLHIGTLLKNPNGSFKDPTNIRTNRYYSLSRNGTLSYHYPGSTVHVLSGVQYNKKRKRLTLKN